MRRRLLPATIASALALACAAVPVPNRLPAIALGAEPVWRAPLLPLAWR